MIELKKCDGELCQRAVKTWVAYCCDPCFLASQRHYEIHETGPLAHTLPCDQRHAERGAYRDPWAPPPESEPVQVAGFRVSQASECLLGHFCFRSGGDTACWECRPDQKEIPMHPHPGQWVTGQTIVSDKTVTGRVIRSAAPVNGRDVVTVSDEEHPEWRAPFHVFADTVTVHGTKPEGV